MTWKGTVLVSGAGLLATWLASAPSTHPAAPARAVRPSATSRPPADIVYEAERLRARMHVVTEYTRPSRNPFRFGEARPSRPAGTQAPLVPEIAPGPIV